MYPHIYIFLVWFSFNKEHPFIDVLAPSACHTQSLSAQFSHRPKLAVIYSVGYSFGETSHTHLVRRPNTEALLFPEGHQSFLYQLSTHPPGEVSYPSGTTAAC